MSLKFDALLSVVRPLQADLESSLKLPGAESTGMPHVNFLEEGIGDFNGIGLMRFLDSDNYLVSFLVVLLYF